MKAMILCAGYGTRLGELTRYTPKPLLQVDGVSLVEYILANLRKHGFEEVMINLHHHSERIREGLASWDRRGVTLSFVHEETLLGTAGAVKNVSEFFTNEEAFVVHYGDVVTNVNLSKMLSFHRSRKATATLLVHQRQRSNSALKFDETYCVREFLERPPAEFWETVDKTWVNSGVMIFCPRVLDLIPTGVPVDWPKDIFPQLIAAGDLYAYCLEDYRIAVDSADRLGQLQSDIRTGRFNGVDV
jgi:NDP-sugar pyrophosphorylase family protein